MPAPDLIVLPDPEVLAGRAAEEFASAAAEALARNPVVRVALAGGSTPRRLYEILARDPFRGRIPWPRVDLFWGDERCVPPDHPDSNFHLVREALVEPLGTGGPNVHRIPVELAAADATEGPDVAARAYEAEIARAFGVPLAGQPPVFDLVLLGLGPDAHTASLFPGSPAVRERVRWVVGVRGAPKPPSDRVTLTPALINRATAVIFLVAGEDKAAALATVLEGTPDPERLPAAAIRPAGRLLWLVDRAAGGRLRAARAGR
jgi:6-phosphogluconolactonase